MDKIKNLLINPSILIRFMIFLLPAVTFAIILTISSAPRLGDMANRVKYSTDNPHGLVEYLSTDEKIAYYFFELSSKMMWTMPILLAVTLVPFIFYKLKIQKPLRLLLDGAEKIANENLDFVIDYDAQDEMGQLSDAFEKMRSSLENNNKETWRMIEERQKLQAVFAHDLRTPLTVLHGYSDFLLKYVPKGKVSQEKLIQTIETMNHHIVRIENYVHHLNTVQKFDDVTAQYTSHSYTTFSNKLQESVQMMDPRKKLIFQVVGEDQLIKIDANLISQVFDNIISNAVEYAENQISIEYQLVEDIFSITICDDGIGFLAEDLPYLTQAFYRAEKDFNKQHTGLGLYIAKRICEKHGGHVILKNHPAGGAIVIASFQVKN